MGVEALALISAGVGAVGSIYSGVEARRSADAEAAQAEIKAISDKLEHTRQLNRTLASQRNLFAARGQAVGGTALSTLTVTERLGRNQLLLAFHASLANASAIRNRGRTAQTKGYFDAAGQLLGGASDYKDSKA